jgi:TatD DNase family protein
MHDAHCHLDLYPDPRAACAQAARVPVILVTTRPSAFENACALAAENPSVHPALGLIPQEAAALEAELPLFLDLLPRARFVGEIGLDGVSPDPAGRAAQSRVFAAILDACAKAGGKVLSIHSRRAATPVLDALAAHGAAFPGTVILHWFSGNAAELGRAADVGCFFSVNPAMVKSAHGRALVRGMPRDRVLLESDGPFVAVDGRPAAPADGGLVVAHLAGLWGMGRQAAEALVDGNFARVAGN